jgi:hypothetical protein
MLKGWNRKVRITKAINRAWMTTRMVSPKPLSDFVPDVTLITFPNSRRDSPRGGRAFASRESPLVSRRKNGPGSDIESEFRRKPESLWLHPRGVLDGCSRPRNQRRCQNLLIH